MNDRSVFCRFESRLRSIFPSPLHDWPHYVSQLSVALNIEMQPIVDIIIRVSFVCLSVCVDEMEKGIGSVLFFDHAIRSYELGQSSGAVRSLHGRRSNV